MIEINEWIDTLREFKLPKYEKLPSIPLYLDQVLEYVNGILSPLFYDESMSVTSAMINNYVKQKLMPAPVKKRYDQDHLAYIITITVLKQVTSIPNVVGGIEVVRSNYSKEQAYDIFTQEVVNGIQTVIAQTFGGESTPHHSNHDVLVPIKAASIAFAAKLISERALLAEITHRGD